jgi:DNA-damage-inducible protein D
MGFGDEEQAIEPFHLDEDNKSFEDFANDNSFRYWWASDLARMLGYDGTKSFQTAINRSMITCDSLGIPIDENILAGNRGGDKDYKLSRFGCYLCAMNGDVRKPAVAAAQAYFVTISQAVLAYVQQQEGVERLVIRSKVTDQEKSLAGVAHEHGVEVYAFFQNAGYRGMYNMDLSKIRQLKGAPDKRSPLDFMGRSELAANLFRITQTEEKIKNEAVRGQAALEATASNVGKKVRSAMLEISGTAPENLPPADDIRTVKKSLKKANSEFKKLDK